MKLSTITIKELRKMKAWIESNEHSIIDADVSLCNWKMKDVLPFRRANMSTTQMVWITKRTCIDIGYTVHNPRTLIMLILN